MAKVKGNILTSGLRGKIGNLVFRTRNGKTHVYEYKPHTKQQSAKQKIQQEKFGAMAKLAQETLTDPEKKKEFAALAKKLGKSNAYLAAMSVMMKK